MQITVLRDDLYQKLTLASSLLTGRISIYDQVNLLVTDRLTLHATDGQVSLFATVGGKVSSKGEISVNGQQLKGVIGTYPVKTSVTITDGNLVCGGFNNTLLMADQNLVPDLPEGDYVEVDLVNKVSQVSWAGYFILGDNQIVAIDSLDSKKQLGVVSNVGLKTDIVVPPSFINLVARLDKKLPCKVLVTNNEIVVHQTDYVIKAALMTPTDLDYAGIIPTDLPNYIQITTELSKAVMNAGKYYPEIILEFDAGVVNIRASDDKLGGADITLNCTGNGTGRVKVFAASLLGALSRGQDKLGLVNGIVVVTGADYLELIAPITR